MDELKEMIQHILRTRMITTVKLSEETGVSLSTINGILSGKARGTRVSTYIKILDYKNKPDEYNEILYLAPGFEPLRNIKVWYD